MDLEGTPFRLYYASDRVPGRTAAYTLEIPVVGDLGSLPASLESIEIEVTIAGKRWTHSLDPSSLSQSGSTLEYTWDGLDAYGRRMQGEHPVTVRLGYTYPLVYMEPAAWARSFSRFGTSPMSLTRLLARTTVWRVWHDYLGVVDSRGLGLGGWLLSPHHVLSPMSGRIFLGDGRRQSKGEIAEAVVTLAGGGSYPIAEGPALEVYLGASGYGKGMAVDADGSVIIPAAHPVGWGRLIRAVPGGSVTSIAGKNGSGSANEGDGASALDASIM
jgi:hypothetical protein